MDAKPDSYSRISETRVRNSPPADHCLGGIVGLISKLSQLTSKCPLTCQCE